MKYLIALLFLFPVAATAQTYSGFKWNTNNISFKSTKMRVYYSGEETDVFNGAKSATISIKQLPLINQTDNKVSASLADYFSIKDANISEFEYKIKKYESTIVYSGTKNDDYIYVALYFDEVSKKVTKIFVSTTKNYVDKNSKALIFILTGFE